MPHNHRNQFGAARPDAHVVRAAVAGRYTPEAASCSHMVFRSKVQDSIPPTQKYLEATN